MIPPWKVDQSWQPSRGGARPCHGRICTYHLANVAAKARGSWIQTWHVGECCFDTIESHPGVFGVFFNVLLMVLLGGIGDVFMMRLRNLYENNIVSLIVVPLSFLASTCFLENMLNLLKDSQIISSKYVNQQYHRDT